MFEKREKDNGVGNFVQLKTAGEMVKGVLAGKPLLFKQHWINQKPFVCTNKPDCPSCATGSKAKKVFRCNFIMKEGDGYVAKILEKGMSVYDQLQAIGADYDLAKYAIKISRSGAGMDTSYAVIVLPPGEQPPAEKLAVIVKTPLVDLDPAKDAVSDFAAPTEEVPF